MANGIRTGDPRGLNKGRSSKFREGFRVKKKHLKKAGGHIGRNVVEKNKKDEDNSSKTLNDKNQKASSQKFRQLVPGPCKRIEKTVKVMVILFTNPSARKGYDTRSTFKRSLTGLNSEFSFS